MQSTLLSIPWAGDATNADPSKVKIATSDNFLAWMNIETPSEVGSERPCPVASECHPALLEGVESSISCTNVRTDVFLARWSNASHGTAITSETQRRPSSDQHLSTHLEAVLGRPVLSLGLRKSNLLQCLWQPFSPCSYKSRSHLHVLV
jgi:hypothetical protein